MFETLRADPIISFDVQEVFTLAAIRWTLAVTRFYEALYLFNCLHLFTVERFFNGVCQIFCSRTGRRGSACIHLQDSFSYGGYIAP